MSWPPRAEIACITSMPVASAVESLNTVAPRSSWLTWWSMIARGPGNRLMSSAMSPSWFQHDRSRMIATSRSASCAGLTVVPNHSNKRLIGIEEVVARRRRAGVDHAHVFSLLAQQPGHADFRAKGIAVGPDVRRYQESVVCFNQVCQRRPVDHQMCPSSVVRCHRGTASPPAYWV